MRMRLEKVTVVSVACVGMLAGVACRVNDKTTTPATAPPATVTSVAEMPDAANASYRIGGKTVTLSGGKADEAAAPGSASRNVTTLTSVQARGDIDGDGKADLAVVLTSSPGGTGTFSYVGVVLSSRGGPWPTALLGDRIAVTNVAVSGSTITVSYLGRPDGAPLAATPSVPLTKLFALSAGELKPN
ncbi:MAG: hypothetical protein U0547_10610 [Dehalococcoidia bacterium]